MERDRLNALLGELQRELASADHLDPDSRQLVEQVLADVDRLDDGGVEGTLAGNVQDLILKVESEHPRLALMLGQVADALARLGI